MQRLQKVLAQAGIASRRKSERLIQEGRVQVNGQLITEMGYKVNPEEDKIKVDNQLIKQEDEVYYMFYKPTGVITSATDPQGRKVVLDFFDHIPERIFPIGRLDMDTSGLLLLSNDGALAHQLMHPSFHVHKTYRVIVEGNPAQRQLDHLRTGIELEDGKTAPAKVILVDRKEKESVLRITIHEGRKRQVRGMFKAIGHPVLYLHREQYAFLTLGTLQEGEYRPLTSAEIQRLKSLVVTQSS